MQQIIISGDVPTLHDYSFMGFFFVIGGGGEVCGKLNQELMWSSTSTYGFTFILWR